MAVAPRRCVEASSADLLALPCSSSDTRRCRNSASGRSAWAPATWMSSASIPTHPSSLMRCSRYRQDWQRRRRRLSRRRQPHRSTCPTRWHLQRHPADRVASKKRRAAFRSSSCRLGAFRRGCSWAAHLCQPRGAVAVSLTEPPSVIAHRMGSQVLLNMFNAKPFFEDCAFIPWEQQKSVCA